MGQRSQIYVRYTTNEGKSYLTARYYQWNYGERMISRCRYTVEWIEGYKEYNWHLTTKPEKLKRIMDVNFDYKDIVIGQDIIEEYIRDFKDNMSFNDFVFECQDNNDGKLFLDVSSEKIKYAFLDDSCDTDNIMTAEKYLEWNYPNFDNSEDVDDDIRIATCENIKYINETAELMTKSELEDFISCYFENGYYTEEKETPLF